MTERPKPVDLDKLDRLHAEATDGTWVPTAEKDKFSSVLFDAYPALSARLRELEDHLAVVYSDEAASDNAATSVKRELEKSREFWKSGWYALDEDARKLRAELEAVKRERDVALKALDRELVGSENLLDALERSDRKP